MVFIKVLIKNILRKNIVGILMKIYLKNFTKKDELLAAALRYPILWGILPFLVLWCILPLPQDILGYFLFASLL